MLLGRSEVTGAGFNEKVFIPVPAGFNHDPVLACGPVQIVPVIRED